MASRPTRFRRFALVTAVYWFLLSYLLAALGWWFIELWRQNEEMLALHLASSAAQPMAEPDQAVRRQDEARRNRMQYIGEGLTFLVVTIAGAVFVYRSARRQIRLDRQQRNFMMAVTHELKTPIAVAKLNVETLLRHGLDEQQRARLLGRTLEETNRLNDLCSNILLSAQLEGGEMPSTREPVELERLVAQSVEGFRSRFPERTIMLEALQPVRMRGDSFLLGIAANNLLENALKYAPADSGISVRLSAHEGWATLEVADSGKGVPDSEKMRIFDRFYRVGSEDVRKKKGTGLGLYLTKRIVQDHGGRISVEDNRPSGAIFLVQLPITDT